MKWFRRLVLIGLLLSLLLCLAWFSLRPPVTSGVLSYNRVLWLSSSTEMTYQDFIDRSLKGVGNYEKIDVTEFPTNIVWALDANNIPKWNVIITEFSNFPSDYPGQYAVFKKLIYSYAVNAIIMYNSTQIVFPDITRATYSEEAYINKTMQLPSSSISDWHDLFSSHFRNPTLVPSRYYTKIFTNYPPNMEDLVNATRQDTNATIRAISMTDYGKGKIVWWFFEPETQVTTYWPHGYTNAWLARLLHYLLPRNFRYGNPKFYVAFRLDDVGDWYTEDESYINYFHNRNLPISLIIERKELDDYFYLWEPLLKNAISYGDEIALHCGDLGHIDYTQKPYQEIYDDLIEAKNWIAANLGYNVRSFAPPGGEYNDVVEQAAKDAGFLSFGTTRYNESVNVPLGGFRASGLIDASTTIKWQDEIDKGDVDALRIIWYCSYQYWSSRNPQIILFHPDRPALQHLGKVLDYLGNLTHGEIVTISDLVEDYRYGFKHHWCGCSFYDFTAIANLNWNSTMKSDDAIIYVNVSQASTRIYLRFNQTISGVELDGVNYPAFYQNYTFVRLSLTGWHKIKVHFGIPKISVVESTGSINSINFANQRLSLTVSAPSGTTFTTKIYCGDRGKPYKVVINNNEQPERDVWTFDPDTKICTISLKDSSSTDILLDWNQ
jgi:peptidoglycan/xylan/chitin deacetylase (PgdA/CDA1 family)